MLCETYLRSRDTELEHPPLDTIYRFSFVSCYISIITMLNPII